MFEPIFSVTKCKRYIKNIANNSDLSKDQDDLDNNQPPHLKVTTEACVYISAVLVYIIAEILESAGNGADNNNKRISPKNVQMAIRGDQELAELLRILITKAKNFPDELPSITNLNITNKEETIL